MSNSLDPDHTRRSVGPDLGRNCLQRSAADGKIAAGRQELKSVDIVVASVSLSVCMSVICPSVMLYPPEWLARLAIDRSICILTRPVVITGFNRSLLVDWSIEKTWLM